MDGYIIYAEMQYKFKMSVLIIMMESQNKNKTSVACVQELLHNSQENKEQCKIKNVGLLLKIYQEFQDGDSRALNPL